MSTAINDLMKNQDNSMACEIRSDVIMSYYLAGIKEKIRNCATINTPSYEGITATTEIKTKVTVAHDGKVLDVYVYPNNYPVQSQQLSKIINVCGPYTSIENIEEKKCDEYIFKLNFVFHKADENKPFPFSMF